MKTNEMILKEMAIQQYGSVKAFTSKIGLSNSTFVSILNRGLNNANIGSIIKICDGLNISAEALANGQILPADVQPNKSGNFDDVNEMLSFIKINILTSESLKINGEPLTNNEKQMLVDAFELSCEMIRRNATRRALEKGGF